MLGFLGFRRLLHAGLSLGKTLYAPQLVLVFLGSCRLLFGKGRICGCPTQSKHQADNLAKLRQEFLSVSELIAKIFGAVSRTTSLMRLSALLANKRCRCRDDGFCSGCGRVARVRLCTLRYACSSSLTCAPCSTPDYLLARCCTLRNLFSVSLTFAACSASDYLLARRCTLRNSFSSFSALAV